MVKYQKQRKCPYCGGICTPELRHYLCRRISHSAAIFHKRVPLPGFSEPRRGVSLLQHSTGVREKSVGELSVGESGLTPYNIFPSETQGGGGGVANG